MPPGPGCDMPSQHLPHRDRILIPVICVVTALLVLGAGELAARKIWYRSQSNACLFDDPRAGAMFRPNCSARMKWLETGWIVDQYNDCGYRTSASCAARPPDGLRLALVGTSLVRGYMVDYPQTLAPRLMNTLSHACGRPVDVQNLSGAAGPEWFTQLQQRLDEALLLKPDAIAVVVSPYDLWQLRGTITSSASHDEAAAPLSPGLIMKIRQFIDATLSVLERYSRLYYAAQQAALRDPYLYAEIETASGDETDFMREPLTPAWRERLKQFDDLAVVLAQRQKTAHVPIIVTYVPMAGQARLAASPPDGIHPYLLTQELDRIVARHGLVLLDTTPAIARDPAVSSLYFTVDGHPRGAGYGIVAASLSQALTHDVLAFERCALPSVHAGAR